MGTLHSNQKGAGHIVAIMAVIIIAGVGFIGYRVSTMSKTPSTTTTVAKSTSSSDPINLSTKSDVKSASKNLDSVTVDSDLDPSQLDKDLADLQ